jgi:protoheme IX farnesyltransferase
MRLGSNTIARTSNGASVLERGQAVPLLATLRALFELTKPTITLTCLIMTGAGLWLAPQAVGFFRALLTLCGTALAVGAANALNMYLERDVDALMTRTRARPIPSGRLSPRSALLFGLVLAVAAVPTLFAGGNVMSAILGAGAIAAYVLVYTPFKRRSPFALVVGTVPGAAPPLIGWAAATGSIDLPGLVLFAILLFWQLPHFIAISIYRHQDYASAGLCTLARARGELVAKRHLVIHTIALLCVSLLLVPTGHAGPLYLAVACAGGAMLLWRAILLLRRADAVVYARRYFFGTLLYLPALVAGLLVDRSISRLLGP